MNSCGWESELDGRGQIGAGLANGSLEARIVSLDGDPGFRKLLDGVTGI